MAKKPASKAKSKKPVDKKASKPKAQATKLTKSSTPIGLSGSPAPINGIDPWTIKDAANTLMQAEQHRQNKPLMKAVQQHVQNMQSVILPKGVK